jgi:CRP/FNR family transcriptional regulator/CRP/FNR family cyclic AMP-dependent transcriptional regulator
VISKLGANQDGKEVVIDMLGAIPLFRGLEREELKAISNSSKEMTFQAGDVMVKEGDAGLGFYLIMEGRAAVKHKGRTLAKLGRGSFFGEMSLLDDQPRSADVVAEESTRCRVLLRWNFWSIVSKNQKIARSLLQEMARRLRATDKALSE